MVLSDILASFTVVICVGCSSLTPTATMTNDVMPCSTTSWSSSTTVNCAATGFGSSKQVWIECSIEFQIGSLNFL